MAPQKPSSSLHPLVFILFAPVTGFVVGVIIFGYMAIQPMQMLIILTAATVIGITVFLLRPHMG